MIWISVTSAMLHAPYNPKALRSVMIFAIAVEHCASVAAVPEKVATTAGLLGVPQPVTCAGGVFPLIPQACSCVPPAVARIA